MYTQISQEQSCTGDNRPAEPVLQRVTVFSLKLKSKPPSDPANNVRLFRNDRTRKTEKCFIWETNDWMCCLISFALTTLSETEGSEADTCTLWRWLLLNKGSKNNVIRYSGIYLIKRALIKGVSLSQVKIRLKICWKMFTLVCRLFPLPACSTKKGRPWWHPLHSNMIVV